MINRFKRIWSGSSFLSCMVRILHWLNRFMDIPCQIMIHFQPRHWRWPNSTSGPRARPYSPLLRWMPPLPFYTSKRPTGSRHTLPPSFLAFCSVTLCWCFLGFRKYFSSTSSCYWFSTFFLSTLQPEYLSLLEEGESRKRKSLVAAGQGKVVVAKRSDFLLFATICVIIY